MGFSGFTVLEVVSEGVGSGEVGTRQPGRFPEQPPSVIPRESEGKPGHKALMAREKVLSA